MNKVSVIITTYNAGKTLAKALDSIFAQTYDNIEVVVIDGGSADNTTAILEASEAENFRYFVGKDVGIYDAMNKGIALSKGDWLIFIGADDRLNDSNVIRDMVDGRHDAGEYDVIIGDVKYDNNKVRRSTLSNTIKFINTVHHQSALYHKNLFSKFRYNKDYKVSADYELNLIVFLKDMNVLKLDRVVTLVGLGGVSSKVDFSGYSEEIQIRNKYLKRSLLRLLINIATISRYLLKRTMLISGVNVHYYN